MEIVLLALRWLMPSWNQNSSLGTTIIRVEANIKTRSPGRLEFTAGRYATGIYRNLPL